MRLEVGMPAPALEGARDDRGAGISLDDYSGHPVLLMFLRYASCPMCLLRVHEVARAHASLSEAGVRPIAVFHSPAHRIRRHAGRLALPYRVIADPSRRLYAAYGVESSWLRLLGSFLRPGFYFDFMRASVLRFWGGAIDGELSRLPADFLISPTGVIAKVHYGHEIGDHMDISEAIRLSRALLSTVPA